MPEEFIENSDYAKAGDRPGSKTFYSCANCGFTKAFTAQATLTSCPSCKSNQWLKSAGESNN
jgi:rubrerythrin